MLRKFFFLIFLISIFLIQGCVTYRLKPEDSDRFKKEIDRINKEINIIPQIPTERDK